MRNFVAIDFETANKNLSSVCSVGIVVVKDENICETFYSLIKPEPEYYLYQHTLIHGICYDDTVKENVFPHVWQHLSHLLEDMPLIAHNKTFDEGCLKACFKTYQIDYPEYEFLCTLQESRKKIKGLVNYKLPTVAAHCGFDLTQHHNALADAYACAHIAMNVFKL